MGELKLTDKTITIDLSKIKWGEWRTFWKGTGTFEEDDALIEKVTGLTTEEQESLLRDDFRRLINAIKKEGQEPLSDPN